ncbi:hypothetical protein Tdes44962_MAKER07397 [Teratosphaeria destructans]|uniref:Uncharacterized protein n=1 Tax=Teratosphaeria destructans TaxID=418781 RepID=A0A9W7SYY7_9PEZI|nr:hypothetical protein Tdes44962_MAKER07397 [Teratosphaeria destructans]
MPINTACRAAAAAASAQPEQKTKEEPPRGVKRSATFLESSYGQKKRYPKGIPLYMYADEAEEVKREEGEVEVKEEEDEDEDVEVKEEEVEVKQEEVEERQGVEVKGKVEVKVEGEVKEEGGEVQARPADLVLPPPALNPAFGGLRAQLLMAEPGM